MEKCPICIQQSWRPLVVQFEKRKEETVKRANASLLLVGLHGVNSIKSSARVHLQREEWRDELQEGGARQICRCAVVPSHPGGPTVPPCSRWIASPCTYLHLPVPAVLYLTLQKSWVPNRGVNTDLGCIAKKTMNQKNSFNVEDPKFQSKEYVSLAAVPPHAQNRNQRQEKTALDVHAEMPYEHPEGNAKCAIGREFRDGVWLNATPLSFQFLVAFDPLFFH